MQQYFINTNFEKNAKIELNKEQAHHVAHVMRMKEGTRIRLANLIGQLFYASIGYEDGGKKVFAQVLEEIVDNTKTRVKITLLQGMIKGEKWDYLLQKSAELGVSQIVPFVSSRSVVKSKEEKIDKKMIRWNKILQEACEQCKRSTLVDLKEPVSFEELITYRSELNIIAYEDADTLSESLSRVLCAHHNITSVSIVVGCEGGFSKEEVAYLQGEGFLSVSLGARILRAETAALALTNSIVFYYDMMEEER
ncbi:MAG: 16S rRNA (uracil(1498)-N(3))-methyltransferase [Longicatena sp.]